MSGCQPHADSGQEEKAGFRHRAGAALADAGLRAKFRRAMDGLMHKRAVQFADPATWNAWREHGAAVRRQALARLPALLEQLEARLTANGISVHWAETLEEANAQVLAILQQAGVQQVVKGKSMVSEEMHLNAHLEAHGIRAVESDLGEYIIQLAGEGPSHIVMPCIHKSRQDIADLFATHIPDMPWTDDVDALTAAARRTLRAAFAAAGAGISGVNMAVAETGTLVLVENEGNGRFSTTLPPLHIAVMGIEKVVARLEDVPPLLRLLPRSATGQPITTYVNFISRPRQDGEKDGPQAVHLVLLDNGRSRIWQDPQLRETLACIRCGACMNHCPVYTRVGGHAYAAPYPGPIGKILTPQLLGLEAAGDLPHASSLCGACAAVCPVRIPLPEILVRLRQEAAKPRPGHPAAGRSERRIWQLWAWFNSRPRLYRWTTAGLSRLSRLLPLAALPPWLLAALPPLARWGRVRTLPRMPGPTLHQQARQRGFSGQIPVPAVAPVPPSSPGEHS